TRSKRDWSSDVCSSDLHAFLFVLDDPDVCKHAQSWGGISHDRDPLDRVSIAESDHCRRDLAHIRLAACCHLHRDYDHLVVGGPAYLAYPGHGTSTSEGEGQRRRPD